MEMGVTLHVARRRPRPVEVVVRWQGPQTARDLRAAVAAFLGHPVAGLVLAGRPVRDDVAVGHPPLVDGVSLVVTSSPPPTPLPGGPVAGLELAAVGGPDAGRSHPVTPPGFDVGRRPGSGMRLDDPSLSRCHLRVSVGPTGVRISDLGSTNGVLVDGEPVRAADVDTRSTVVVGRTTMRLRRTPGAGLPLGVPGDGTIRVAPGPRPRPPTWTAREVDAPSPPAEPPRARVPWVAALVPLPVALVLALLLGPQLLAVALLGPVTVLGTALGDRVTGGRQRRRAVAEHERALTEARDALATALAGEAHDRHAAHPDPHVVLRRAEHRLPGLWAAASPGVRLGLGDVEATTSWRDAGRAEPVTARGVPVVVDLAALGSLGLVGDEHATRRLLDWVLGQLCTSLPPGRLSITSGNEDLLGAWWRVPHARAAPAAESLRLTVCRAGDAARGSALTGDGAAALVLAPDAGSLPGDCGARVEADGSGGHVLVGDDGRRTALVADGVGSWWADRVARALAPLRTAVDAGPALDDGDRLTLGRLLGPERLSPEGLRAGWDAAGGGPVAVVGTSGGAVHRIDLSRDGPHVLVGGTTGSGKSEFLRTLVTGLAVGSPPEMLVLLLVDFKGGAAFGPCSRLPHVVGLVTDLDEHLAHRVLTSLRAELRRREELLSTAGVADVADLGPDAAPPRLVVVVDELRALVDELPDLVSGLVRIAAQGRSLGIHLVLATQRPSGTITPEIQANVDLRVAFRVRDRADSVDVLDAPDAAHLAPDTPGWGVARGGDGALTRFRTALVAPVVAAVPFIEVARRHRQCTVPGPPRDRAAETAAVVDAVAAAAGRGVATPPPPWVPPLPRVVPREGLDPAGTVALVDEPDRQRRRPLLWEAPAGPWRVVGRPLSGRTTALRALVTAAVATCPPDRLHVHVLDAAGGLADLVALPHVGTWCRVDDPVATAELVAHLAAEVATRRATTPPEAARPEMLLVVDGWEQLVEADDPRSPDPVSDRVLRLLRDGSGVGVLAAAAGGRSLLHPRWAALGGTTLLLGRVDALDAIAAGIREHDVPRDPPPGRGVLAGEGREVQVVGATRADTTAAAAHWPAPTSSAGPWRYRPLPDLVRRGDLGRAAAGHLLVGAAGPRATGWAWDPAATGGRLLVTGPPRSGRTTTLWTLAESAVEVGRAVVLVARSAGTSSADGIHGLTVLRPDEADALVAVLRRDRGVVVLVDDADRLDDAPVRPVLGEMGDLAERDGGAVVVATTTARLGTRYRGLDVEASRHGCGIVLAPRAADGEVLGVRPRPILAARPGRGVVVTHGTTLDLQVLLPQSVGGPAPPASS